MLEAIEETVWTKNAGVKANSGGIWNRDACTAKEVAYTRDYNNKTDNSKEFPSQSF